MNTRLVEDIAAAVLYEGYLLYPYRASATKNRQRWNFGVLYPRAYAEQQSGADAWSMRTECLVRAPSKAITGVRVRFLHLIARVSHGQDLQGAIERDVILPGAQLSDLVANPLREQIAFPQADDQKPIEAMVEAAAWQIENDLFKLRISIYNTAEFSGSSRDDALMQSLVSTHTIIALDQGEFISLLEPPDALRDAAAACENSGTWPVLVGEEGSKDAMLSSPIILYDYPQIAPESPGALFDGTEIDEILTLRIMTLTDDEKLAMAQTDERAREILERTDSMTPEQFMKLHGTLRELHAVPPEAP